jgi:hypothetical protein
VTCQALDVFDRLIPVSFEPLLQLTLEDTNVFDTVAQQNGAEHRHVGAREQHFNCIAPAMDAATFSQICTDSAMENADPSQG